MKLVYFTFTIFVLAAVASLETSNVHAEVGNPILGDKNADPFAPATAPSQLEKECVEDTEKLKDELRNHRDKFASKRIEIERSFPRKDEANSPFPTGQEINEKNVAVVEGISINYLDSVSVLVDSFCRKIGEN